jgi:hypothetical protein
MTEPFLGWEWFEAGMCEERDAGAGDAADTLSGAFARCFRSADGARVLQSLRSMTLEQAVGPSASDAVLRHLEGQRALFVYIEAMIARGNRPQVD